MHVETDFSRLRCWVFQPITSSHFSCFANKALHEEIRCHFCENDGFHPCDQITFQLFHHTLIQCLIWRFVKYRSDNGVPRHLQRLRFNFVFLASLRFAECMAFLHVCVQWEIKLLYLPRVNISNLIWINIWKGIYDGVSLFAEYTDFMLVTSS